MSGRRGIRGCGGLNLLLHCSLQLLLRICCMAAGRRRILSSLLAFARVRSACDSRCGFLLFCYALSRTALVLSFLHFNAFSWVMCYASLVMVDSPPSMLCHVSRLLLLFSTTPGSAPFAIVVPKYSVHSPVTALRPPQMSPRFSRVLLLSCPPKIPPIEAALPSSSPFSTSNTPLPGTLPFLSPATTPPVDQHLYLPPSSRPRRPPLRHAPLPWGNEKLRVQAPQHALRHTALQRRQSRPPPPPPFPPFDAGGQHARGAEHVVRARRCARGGLSLLLVLLLVLVIAVVRMGSGPRERDEDEYAFLPRESAEREREGVRQEGGAGGGAGGGAAVVGGGRGGGDEGNGGGEEGREEERSGEGWDWCI